MTTLRSSVRAVEEELRELANPEQASFLKRFFKTGPGQYGKGDEFLGIRVPALRKLSRKHAFLGLDGVSKLMRSRHHEARLLALLILVRAYERGDEETRDAIFELYLGNTERVNNWDLVDSSAPHIVGAHLRERDRSPLVELARSESLWERRIAILATFCFIKGGEFEDTFRIADILLTDEHDLIHKAVGWMLREVGNRDRGAEETFLRTRYQKMPRTMLRYAVEKFPAPLRQRYLRGAV